MSPVSTSSYTPMRQRARCGSPVGRPKRSAGAHVVMVAVSTTDPEGNWQTGTILRCLSEIVPLLADDAVLVVRSTIPPDFVRQLGSIVDEIRDQAGRPRVPVMLNPEFTRESQAVADFLGPDRVVAGHHPRPRWPWRPNRPARLPPGRRPDHRPPRGRRVALEARRQPLPGDEDLVRQRARSPVRRLRRPGRRGRRGDGLRRPDRRQLPQGGRRLRRLVPAAPGHPDGPQRGPDRGRDPAPRRRRPDQPRPAHRARRPTRGADRR